MLAIKCIAEFWLLYSSLMKRRVSKGTAEGWLNRTRNASSCDRKEQHCPELLGKAGTKRFKQSSVTRKIALLTHETLFQLNRESTMYQGD
jgi:hypothetical protein